MDRVLGPLVVDNVREVRDAPLCFDVDSLVRPVRTPFIYGGRVVVRNPRTTIVEIFGLDNPGKGVWSIECCLT
ncbi:hypothetical protein DSECCO2_518550 [anaerobic digester metagenome]